MENQTSNRYDRAYFDRWYRNRRTRVSTKASTERKARLAVAMAEFHLGRPVSNVLDIGCGEGQWRAILKAIRPHIEYSGIDSSPYVVKRFGRHRNLKFGSFGDLQIDGTYDLIICSDLLYYVCDAELKRGLPILAAHLDGVALLEAYCCSGEFNGDTAIVPRTAAKYRRFFKTAGLLPVGSHCYVGPSLAAQLSPLETLIS